MPSKKEIGSPKKGMNRDKAPFDLTKVEYSFMLNGNFQDEHGSGQINLQNEPSNVYCSGFKDGFKVIGHKYDINRDLTYFFLVNPTTNVSEIGYISSFTNIDGLEQVEQECGCNISVVLENPLEDQIQEAICTYNTLVSDYCDLIGEGTECLGFDINYPIHESNIHLKDEASGRVLYWADGKNPQRHLKLDDLDSYTTDVDPCTGEEAETCFDCDKLRVFKLFDKPCITVNPLQNGGNLNMGMYEVLTSYCDQLGNEISDYYAITNPIPIFDRNNTVLDQTLLDSQTNFALSLDMVDMDDTYEYFKIVVMYRSGLDAALSVREVGVYPINTEKVIVPTLVDTKTLEIREVLSRRTVYDTAKGMASGNGYLFHHGLTAHREVNLQPVVSLLGSLVKWATVKADEEIYKEGHNVSNFLGYMRDEVEPLSIKIIFDGGYETALFPFVPRPPKASEIEELGVDYASDNNNQSVLEHNPECSGNERNKRWQFENTAEILGDCVVPAESPYEEVTVTRTMFDDCLLSSGGNPVIVDTIAGPIQLPIDAVEDIVTYINENQAEILASTDPLWTGVQAIIDNPADYPGNCSPDFGANCGASTLVSEVILAYSVGSETKEEVSIPFSEYDRPLAPQPGSCNQFVDPLTQDSSFEGTYMRSGEVAYNRNTPSNLTCGSALPAPPFTDPQSDNATYLTYKGSLETGLGISALQQSAITVSAVNLSAGFTANLHEDALWFEVPFNGMDFVVFEITPTTIGTTDDVCQSSVRVSAFTDCSSLTDVASYARIISDMTLANDSNKFFVLDASDFGGTTSSAFIAIDSPILTDVDWDLTVTETGGGAAPGDSFDIEIESTPYTVTFDTNPTTTASNFVTANQATLLSLHNILVTSSGADIEFRSTQNQYDTLSITNITGNLTGVASVVEKYHVLSPVCGCFNVYSREAETRTIVQVTDLEFVKQQIYSAECDFTIPDLKGCEPVPDRYGLFSYWESILKYPCNDQLWDSSTINVKPADIATLSTAEQDEFVEYYVEVDGLGNPVLDGDGNFVWKTDGSGTPLVNFKDRPIRHYKFPCSTIVPFMSTEEQDPGAFNNSIVYPIGFSISNEAIEAFLDIAVSNGLLTPEERLKAKKYEIYRGDRSVDKSIVAKGLLFDMYYYQENDAGEVAYYPNYPLNALGKDNLNGNVQHPFFGLGNNTFTFHSPDTHFYNPTLPGEMKVEGYVFGRAANYFDEVDDHSKQVILSNGAYNIATTLATAEVILDIVVENANFLINATSGGAVGTPIATPIAIATGVYVAFNAVFRVGELRYKWIETLRGLGKAEQFGYFQTAVGHYNFFKPNDVADSLLRGLRKVTYLEEGRVQIPNEGTGLSWNVNNLDREDSVFISTGEYTVSYPIYYATYDNTDFPSLYLPSRTRSNYVGRSPRIVTAAASPYASLKQYLPAQYGSIQSVNWVHTGYCGKLSDRNGCDPIFGGDTYISRFSLKRKFPFFTSDAHGLAPRTPFKYSDYFNVNPLVDTNRYYVDYLINDDSNNFVSLYVFPTNRSVVKLDQLSNNLFYVQPPSKFYLYSYGIPYFLVESVINCNYRYAKREQQEEFYPNVGDPVDWTQESNVSIREPNTFFYNFVYSGLKSNYPWRTLPDNFDAEVYEALRYLDNSVIYSLKDNSETSLVDPWLVYRALDSYIFPKTFGKLVDMDSIESEAILARFENGVTLFGAIDQLADRLTSETKNIGQGGIFAGRSINFNKTDLGYGGTQHVSKVSCEFGHFWPDARRGKVFQMGPNGKGFNEISIGLEKWFKENLPFKISKYVSGLELEDLDNTFKGIGITMGWDDRMKRVFLTKKDYKTKVQGIEYIDKEFYLRNGETLTKIELTDDRYFQECSFTIAYSPVSGSWISYYSFLPNYYIAYSDYFQTGVNFSSDSSEIGLWSHFSFLSSYQVFYGKKFPWIIEQVLPSKFSNSVLESVEYWMDVRKYYNKYDFSDVYGTGFNKAFIYNSQQNTGQLNLVHQRENDMQQSIQYPKHNNDSVDILQSEINGRWSFNSIYNMIRNEKAGLPIWINDCNQVNKTLDNRLLDYRSTYKDRLRGDYFILRLQQDEETRFKMIYRFNVDKRNYYE